MRRPRWIACRSIRCAAPRRWSTCPRCWRVCRAWPCGTGRTIRRTCSWRCAASARAPRLACAACGSMSTASPRPCPTARARPPPPTWPMPAVSRCCAVRLTRVIGQFNYFNQPLAQDPLGLTRAQANANPRQAVPAATQFDTGKNVEQAQAGVVVEHQLSDIDSLTGRLYGGNPQPVPAPRVQRRRADVIRRHRRPGSHLWRRRAVVEPAHHRQRPAAAVDGRGGGQRHARRPQRLRQPGRQPGRAAA